MSLNWREINLENETKACGLEVNHAYALQL